MLNEVEIVENDIKKRYRYTLFMLLVSILTFGKFVTFQMLLLSTVIYIAVKYIRDKKVQINEIVITLIPAIVTIRTFELLGGVHGDVKFPKNFFAVIVATIINYLVYTVLKIVNDKGFKGIFKSIYKEYLWIIKYDILQAVYAVLFTNTAFVFLYDNLIRVPTAETGNNVDKILYLILWVIVNGFIMWFLLKEKLTSFKVFIKSNVENIHNVTDSLNEAVLTLDKNYIIKFKNPAAESLIQIKDDFKQTFKQFENSLLDYEEIKKEIFDAIDSNEIYKRELKFKDGVAYEMLLSPEENRFKDITGTVIIIYDVTEHERLLAEIKDKEAQLLISEKMAVIGQITAGVAHEINTPLGSIKSNVGMEKMLLPAIENEDVKNGLVSMNEVNEMAIDRIMEIVKGLKNFARLDESVFKEADINDGIRSTLMIAKSQLKDVVLTEQYGEIPLIKCFPQQLNQVFLNIIVNAAQALDKSEKKLKIETKLEDGNILVIIEDNGMGISKEKIEKIFEPGYTTKGVGVGTGLGLSISYKIIEKHKGEILVDSVIGEKTIFTIKLPIGGENE